MGEPLRVLMLPSHVGLGHVARDAAIAEALRRMAPGVVVEWCSAEPAAGYLRLRGERLAPGCGGLESFSTVIEDLYNGGIRGLRGLAERLELLRRNYDAVEGLLAGERYRLVYADEFWELLYPGAPMEQRRRIVFATDIVYKPYSLNPVDSLVSLLLNRYFRRNLTGFRELIYLNSPEMLRGKHWLPLHLGGEVAKWLERRATIAGLATSYLPGQLPSPEEARRQLGIGSSEALVTITVGGTSTRSKPLLDCIARAASELAKTVREETGAKNVVIHVVTGPRTGWHPPPDTRVPIVVKRALPSLTAHYQASTLLVTRAGRTTTADILCAAKQAVLIPIRRHFEQEEIARHMNRRHGYPVVKEDKCSPQRLAKAAKKALHHSPKPPRELCRGTILTATRLRQHLEQSTATP